MSGLKSACLTAVFLTAVSMPAFAQDGPAEPFSRAYVSALAGIAFTEDRSPMLALEYGERVHDFVQAYANLTYFNDVMTSRTRSHLSAAAAALAASTGTPWNFQGRDQGVAFTVGAKAVLARGPVRPYIGGGAGALNLRRKVVESSRGDVTDSFMDVFGSNDGNIGSTSASTTKVIMGTTTDRRWQRNMQASCLYVFRV